MYFPFGLSRWRWSTAIATNRTIGAMVVRDGTAVYLAPGGIPAIFDHDGVSQVVGD
jgi:hypothetical protein